MTGHLSPLTEFRRRTAAIWGLVVNIWDQAVLPLIGVLLWVVLVTEFTKFSSTDALLVVLAFSIWRCSRWLGGLLKDIHTRLVSIELDILHMSCVAEKCPDGFMIKLPGDLTFTFRDRSQTHRDSN